uniref:Uncharacterized protein n=1 Tax=Oryza punctata TaxID=4537 RepID=A0A0E0JQV9_ORYPU
MRQKGLVPNSARYALTMTICFLCKDDKCQEAEALLDDMVRAENSIASDKDRQQKAEDKCTEHFLQNKGMETSSIQRDKNVGILYRLLTKLCSRSSLVISRSIWFKEMSTLSKFLHPGLLVLS